MEQHWAGYVAAIGARPASSMPPVKVYDSTGFLNIEPARPEVQARYDAMSATWNGVEATNKALGHGLFSTDAMPIHKNTASK